MEHRISSVRVHLVSADVPGNYADATRKVETIGFAIVRIATGQGLEGFGVTYHEVGGEAVADLVERAMAPRLIGRDPLESDALWHEFTGYLRGVGRKGLAFCALSAVDTALWDLKGKITGLPLYRLLGGNRRRVPVYASGGWTSFSDDELVAEVEDMVARGYTTVKFKVGVDGGTAPNRDLLRVRKVREAIGPEPRILLDANNCWTAATAARFANQVKELDVLLLEEPVSADDIPGLARYRAATDLPLATGEHEYTKFGARDLLLAGAADFLQLDVARAGGYTEMVKVAALAEAWNVPLAPHAMELMHLQLAGAVENIPFLERLLMFENLTNAVFVDPPVPHDGFLEVPDLPGLGLVLDMEYISARDER